MASLSPVSHQELVRRLRGIGFVGPFAGGRHLYMVKDEVRLAIPNPHGREIGPALLARILKQAGVERDVWIRS